MDLHLIARARSYRLGEDCRVGSDPDDTTVLGQFGQLPRLDLTTTEIVQPYGYSSVGELLHGIGHGDFSRL